MKTPELHRDSAVSEGQLDDSDETIMPTRRPWLRHFGGLALGVVLALIVYFIFPKELSADLTAQLTAKEIEPDGDKIALTAAIAILMGVWWMTEAIPLAATALVPVTLFPLLGIMGYSDVGSSYASSTIFLFMGGFFLALAMQRWNFHRRLALTIVLAVGTKPKRLVLGFMVATGFLSMWVSNTATAVMMLPIGISVLATIGHVEDESGEKKLSNFGTALMLGIAYAASVGSLATIIGTPPNTLLAGYLSTEHDVQLGFGQWMLVGLPLSLVMLVITWFLLTKVLFKPEIERLPGGRELFDDELAKLGPTSSGEKRVLAVFVAAAVAWVSVPLLFEDPPISDAGIALAAGLLLFLLPAGTRRGVRLLTWDAALDLPWGVLLLFGGGLALSSQFSGSGLTDWIGDQAGALGGLPIVLLVVIAAAGIIFLTELTSNTATAATFLPVAGGVALGLGVDPMLLAVPVALAATCAFMLPVATPPNAIAYGSGYVTIGQMIRGGLWLNLIGIVLITLVTMTLLVWVFGLTL